MSSILAMVSTLTQLVVGFKKCARFAAALSDRRVARGA